MSQSFTLTSKDGKTRKVNFTKKRGQILELLKAGKAVGEVVSQGFAKGTVNIVRNEAKKLGLLTK